MISTWVKTSIYRLSLAMNEKRTLIAVCQLNSNHDLEENFKAARTMMLRASKQQAQMVFFPECFDYVGRSREETESMAMTEESEYIGRYRDCAKEFGLWLSLGGFHHKDPAGLRKPFNTHLIIDDKGQTRGSYNKLHLFDLDIPGKLRLIESDISSPGNEIPKPVCTPVGNVGMSICYDLRFAELAIWYRMNGAHILTYPAAFTVDTGVPHWEVLLRARAIETQCYVVAAAQIGKHNSKRMSYGHSMIVDPWGTIIAQCSETVDICFAEIRLEYLEKVRALQPVIAHRRFDLYAVVADQKDDIGINGYEFGSHIIPPEHVFYRTTYTFCFVNRKPIVQGHVLLSPIRKVKRLIEMTHVETSDLFLTGKKVQTMLENYYSVTSSTVCVQDGPDAGQTVWHVHLHILPRRQSDFGNDPDRLYSELYEHDKVKDEVKFRDSEEMRKEAEAYRFLMNGKVAG